MQKDSIVKLKNAFSANDIRKLNESGITRYPQLDNYYMVDFLRPPSYPDSFSVCIVLVEFPEYEANRTNKIDLNADSFVEVLPPNPIEIEQIIEEMASV